MENSGQNMPRPLYNSRIIDTYIKLIKRKYSYINVTELLNHAKMKPYEVADQGHWFTQEQINLFHERLTKLTGNAEIAREAGRYAASPEAIGVMRQYILGMVGPAKAFEMLGKASVNFTKSSIYESKKIASNKIEIVVTPNKDTNEKSFQCENRAGSWEAIVMAFTNKLPNIEHPECMFSGGKVCRYIVSWDKSLSAFWIKIRNYSIPVFSSLIILSAILNLNFTLQTTLPILAAIFFLFNFFVENKGKKELLLSLDNLRGSSDKLLDQINLNYNNALMTNEIGQAISRQTNIQIGQSISKQTNIDGLLEKIVTILEKRLDYDRGLILLASPEKTNLIFRAGFGYNEDLLNLLNKTAFHLDRPESKGAFIVCFREQKPFLVNDLDEIGDTLSSRSLAIARKLGTHSFICCPIICDGQSLGVLAVDNLKSKRPLVHSDMSLLMGIAPVIGVSIRNAELIDASTRQFNSILQVLAASTDARDPLTAGHSVKVTEYALGICEELELSREYCEVVRVAALLHDYGKIGVPDAILKKDGRLTDEEYEIVKTHSEKTREILEQVNFEGIFRQVPEIAGAHHEKIDGSGYPRGLKGKEIPLGARIIAVADFFEALTTKRHYRGPMPVEIAFKLLREESGVHFEKRLVEAFILYFKKIHGEQNPPTGDQRQLRVPMKTDISFRLNGAEVSGTSEDISVRGIYVATNDEVDEGVPVELSFTLPHHSRSELIEAKGRVVWVNDSKIRRKTSLPAGFGVEFLEIKSVASEAIKTFVNACHPYKERGIAGGMFPNDFDLGKMGLPN
jgi:uncharacterized protein (TIGR02266 family)